ncbi:MAG TPA: hypothetical protein VKU19_15860 [Bryobacteraceae bacterium]|nr:hypothetical protein [Bryobacteraceae bacterium]
MSLGKQNSSRNRAVRGSRQSVKGTGGPGLRRTPRLTSVTSNEPVPVWLAVLLAAGCQATGNGEDHAVRWTCSTGRAMYTNSRAHTVRIEPFGVSLKQGHTLAVCWSPGETSYSLEVLRRFDQCV